MDQASSAAVETSRRWTGVVPLPAEDPGVPDTRSPVRLLLWVGRQQIPTLLAGVLFWRWDVLALLVLFWMENVVVGLFFALRMVLGGIAAMTLGSPVWALLVLLGLKIALDFKAHVEEHSPSRS